MTVALNYEEIKKDSQRKTEIKYFTNKCKWQKKKKLSEKIDWKKFEKNNATITLNGHAYVSKHNSGREKQVFF